MVDNVSFCKPQPNAVKILANESNYQYSWLFTIFGSRGQLGPIITKH